MIIQKVKENSMMMQQTRREGEIWQACDDLWSLHASASKLTGDAIRDRLLALGYKRGSPNEIYKYRKSWQQSRGVNELEHDEGMIESDPITRAVTLVHEQLRTQSNQRIDAVKLELEARIAQMQTSFDQLGSDYKCLQSKSSHLETVLLETQTENAVLKENLQQEKQKNDVLLERLSAANALIGEIKRNYERESQKVGEVFSESLQKRDGEILKLNAKIAELGQIFSEELTAMKLGQHNLNLQKHELKKKARLNSLKNISLQEISKNISLEKKSLEQELMKLKKEHHLNREKLVQSKTQLSTLNKENRELSKQLKKILSKKEKTK